MHRIEYIIVAALFKLFNNLSLRSGKRAALAMCLLIAKVFRYRRKVIIANLRRVYGDDWPMPRKEMIRQIYRHFVFLWMEVLQINHLTRDNYEAHVHFHNIEILEDALRKGKGVILTSGHIGNFEWLGQALLFKNYKVAGIAKQQRNPLTNDFIEKTRCCNGLKVIYTKNAMAEGIEFLRGNGMLAIASDQDAKKKGIFVEFLGQPSSTAVGTAIFQLRTAAPLVFIIAVRRDYGQFDVFFEQVCLDEERLITDEAIFDITQRLTSILEKWIRQYPEQWFWMHRRWKTKP